MENSDLERENPLLAPGDRFEARQAALRRRVAEAARALSDQGVRPTVARIRAALGGGSPNDLAPALKHWKGSLQTHSWEVGRPSPLPIPAQIADLAHELWQRATAAAVIELHGGPAARHAIHRAEEVVSLQDQVTALRDQLQRESLAYGELRAQAARARETLARADAATVREQQLLRDLGSANQRVAELEATVERLRASAAK